MGFIESTPPDRAQGDLAEAYERIAGLRGGVAEVMSIQSLNPAAMAAHFDFYKTLMFGRSELSRHTREMIGVVVSAANGCDYCIAHHLAPLRALKVSEAVLDRLAAGEVPDEYVAEPVQRLLHFARALTLDPKPDPDAIAALRQLGWTDAAVLDATLIASYFNFVNRLVLSLGVELEDRFEVTCRPDLD